MRKITRAKELAAAHRALRLIPGEWMIPLFGKPEAGRVTRAASGRRRNCGQQKEFAAGVPAFADVQCGTPVSGREGLGDRDANFPLAAFGSGVQERGGRCECACRARA